MKKIITSILLCCLLFLAKAQDPHFSQYNAAPASLNPALTGFFDGDYRGIINYRSQWGSFTDPFRTIAASFELSIPVGPKRDDNIGVGLSFYNDKAGSTEFGTNSITLGLAYKKTLSSSTKQTIGFGLQTALLSQSINEEELIFDNQFNGVEVDLTIPSGEFISGGNSIGVDLNVGMLYQVYPSKLFNFYMGAAYQHILQPEMSLLDDAVGFRLKPKVTAHVGAKIDATSIINILPSILFLQQAGAMQVNAGTYLQFHMNYFNDNETALAIGLWTRIAQATPDAVIMGARLDFQGIAVGLSYDLNISGLNVVSQGRGAYELSIIYTGRYVSRGARRFQIPCPQL